MPTGPTVTSLKRALAPCFAMRRATRIQPSRPQAQVSTSMPRRAVSRRRPRMSSSTWLPRSGAGTDVLAIGLHAQTPALGNCAQRIARIAGKALCLFDRELSQPNRWAVSRFRRGKACAVARCLWGLHRRTRRRNHAHRPHGRSPRGKHPTMDAPFGSWGTHPFVAGSAPDAAVSRRSKAQWMYRTLPPMSERLRCRNGTPAPPRHGLGPHIGSTIVAPSR